MSEDTTAVCRTAKGTVDCFFEIRFVERCYDACARWYRSDSPYWPYYDPGSHGLRKVEGVADDRDRILDREPEVKKAVLNALDHIEIQVEKHDPALAAGSNGTKKLTQEESLLYGKNFEGARFLRACVNPECTLRTWDVIDFAKRERISVTESKPAHVEFCSHFAEDENIRNDLKAMAGCEDYKSDSYTLTKACTCKKKRHLFKIIPIRNKWIYGFTASGKHLHPEWEIHAESEKTGRIHWRFAGGKFSDAGSTAYSGSMPLPNPANKTWHFFLSPVKLGPKALDLLCKHEESKLIFSKRDTDQLPGEPPSEYEPPIEASLQPWALTAKRRFFNDQIPTRFEYVPLVDPFAWADMAVQADYIPILDAERMLATNEKERSKWFVARTFRGAIADNDRYDLDQMLHRPPHSEGNVNIAEAWMRHYESLADYLATEVDRAFRRVRQAVLRSPGHRVVEVTCQEHSKEPKYLQFGLLHWQHLLAEALSCPSGKEFAKWIVRRDALKERIPMANVLHGEGLTQDSAYIKAFGPAAPAQIFASLLPVLIVTPDDSGAAPPKTVSEYFAKTALEKKSFWWRDEPGEFILPSSEISLEIKEEEFGKYFGKFQAQFSSEENPMRARATSFDRWRGTLVTFKALAAIWAIASKLKDFKERLESRGEFGWDAFDVYRATFLELPGTSAELLQATGIIQEVSREELEEEFKVLMLERHEIFMGAIRDRKYKYGVWEAILKENKAEREAIHAQLKEGGVRILKIVGIITAILDLISETGQTLEAERGGERGVAVGHAIKAGGALVVVLPLAARFLGLVTAAEYEALAGPIGWIGAAATLCGALWVYLLTKTGLQLFAERCFLGRAYGEGDFEKEAEEGWMARKSWPELRYEKSSHKQADDRFARQANALLYMFCNFTIQAPYDGGCWIRPRLIPDGGVFRVQVTMYPKSGRSSNGFSAPQTYNALCFPTEYPSQCKHRWIGEAPSNGSSIEFHGEQGRLDHIHVRVNPPVGEPAAAIIYRVNLCRMASGGSLSRILPVAGAEEWVETSSLRTGLEVEALSVLPPREEKAEKKNADEEKVEEESPVE